MSNANEAKQAPVMPGQHWLLGSAGKFKNNPLGLLQQMRSIDSPVVRFRLAIIKSYYVGSVEGVDRILRGNVKNYFKGGILFDTAKFVFGNNIVFANDEFWARQRRIMNPMFHKKSIDSFFEAIEAIVDSNLAKWKQHTREGKGAYNVHDDNMRAVNDIIVRLVFDSGLTKQEQNDMLDAMNLMLDQTQQRTQNGINAPAWWPNKLNKNLKTAQETFYRLALKVINYRKSQEPSHNMLDMLLAAKDEESGEQMNLEQIINEVKVFFVAGTETAANTTSWCMYMLAKHPEAEAKVREELDRVLGDGPLTMENAGQLTYLTQCLNETMRMMPPAWMLTRTALEDDVVDGYKIEKGASVFISPIMLHTEPEVWGDPESFRPERFAKENLTDQQRKAHVPFGNGQRRCIGERLAWVMMWTMMGQYMRHYKWTLDESRPTEPHYAATLQPDALWLNLEPLRSEEPVEVEAPVPAV